MTRVSIVGRRHWLVGAMLGALVGVAAGPASAELIVLRSSVPGLKSGDLVSDDRRIRIPPKRQIKVLVPNGLTLTVKGPFDDLAGKIANSVPANPKLWAKLKKVMARRRARTAAYFAPTKKSRKAGAKLSARKKGLSGPATRGFLAPTGPRKTPALNEISATAEGNVCIDPKRQLMLLRPPFAASDELTIASRRPRRRMIVRWPSGVRAVPWPQRMGPGDGAQYLLKLEELPARKVTIRFLKGPIPPPDSLLPALHANECEFQIEVWLTSQMLAG